MARKKKQENVTTTYLVMVHSDGSPTQVLLPDGRMAILVPQNDLYACTDASTFTGVVRKLRGRTFEIMSDEDESIEDIREGLIFDGYDPKKVKAMKLEKCPLISFT